MQNIIRFHQDLGVINTIQRLGLRDISDQPGFGSSCNPTTEGFLSWHLHYHFRHKVLGFEFEIWNNLSSLFLQTRNLRMSQGGSNSKWGLLATLNTSWMDNNPCFWVPELWCKNITSAMLLAWYTEWPMWAPHHVGDELQEADSDFLDHGLDAAVHVRKCLSGCIGQVKPGGMMGFVMGVRCRVSFGKSLSVGYFDLFCVLKV